MKYKLLAADVDGTLLNSRGELSAYTIRTINGAIRNGLYFVISTGRPFQGVNRFKMVLNIDDMPLILYNGAMATVGEKIIYSQTLSPSDAREIIDVAHDTGFTLMAWSNNNYYSETINEKVNTYKSISKVEPIVVKDLSQIAEQGITKFVLYADDENAARLQRELTPVFAGRVNCHTTRPYFLEFVDVRCSKAVALQKICDAIGVDVAQTVAVGDGFNDLSMIEYAALGAAMGNSPDEVKNRSNIVLPTNDEDGVAHLINEYILR